MDWTINPLIYCVVLAASVHMTYLITKQHWIARTLDWCKENDLIDFDDD